MLLQADVSAHQAFLNKTACNGGLNTCMPSMNEFKTKTNSESVQQTENYFLYKYTVSSTNLPNKGGTNLKNWSSLQTVS